MLRSISEGLSNDIYSDGIIDRGAELEELLTIICTTLGEVGTLTENKADVEFLLGIQGTYLISKKRDKLPDDAQPPSYLYNSNLFPMIDKMEEVVVEDIVDE